MKSNQKLSIMFWLFKAKATKDGRAPLYARVTIGGDFKEISLNRKVLPKHWDTNLKRVTEASSESRTTNLSIAEAEVVLEKHFIVLQSQYEKITAQMLKNAYLGLPIMYDGGGIVVKEYEKRDTLLNAFSEFIEKFKKQVSKGLKSAGTLRHWISTKNKVEEFLKFQYGIEDIRLADIKYSFAEKFYDYTTLEVDEPLSEVTSKGHIKKIKQILKGCVSKDLIFKNPIQDYSCAGGEKEVAPLEMEEVQRIYHKDFGCDRLNEVRDVFIFQCFTGFAYQDVYGLSPEHIVKVGNKGERWLIKDRGKTGVSEMVPILPIVEDLIKKYEEHPYCIANNCLLPVNSNERYNGYLKEIGNICCIIRDEGERGLGTHLARHTFADIMLNSGVPLEDVSKMLGHKSIRTTQRYCRVRKNRISEIMYNVKNVLFNELGELKKVS